MWLSAVCLTSVYLYHFFVYTFYRIPDPLKPPPITNYMSVKIEILMNCLEKMYHNHLPLNAFTSRFPNARAKAMLTLMLDGHRQECDSCDKILDDANVGIFHGDEQKLKMDLGKYYYY